MVQLVALAATSAIVASTVGAQTQDGRAQQTDAAADPSGGGLFSELLAALLGEATPSQDAAATQLSADLSQQSAQQGSAIPGQTTPSGQSSANGQTNNSANTTGNQSNWLAAWLATLAQQMQQVSPGSNPQASLAALLEGQTGQPSGTSPANAQGPGSTQDPPQDASLLAALQSLAAQYQASQNGAATPTASTQTPTSSNATPATTSSNPQLAALLQTLEADQAAMTGAAADKTAASTDTANTQQAAPTTPAAQQAATSQTNGAAAPATPQRPQIAQATQPLPRDGSPVTAALSPPLHFNQNGGGANTSSQGQNGQHGSSQTNTSTPAQSQASSSASADSSAPNSNTQTVIPPMHDQNAAQPGSTAPAALANQAANNNAGVNAVSAVQTSQAPNQPVAATLQVTPSSPSSNSTPDVHALAVSIAAQSQAGAKQFDIRLDPPELGRVDVRLTVDSTGKAQAHLAVDKPQTLELLQKDSGNLARALKDSGVQLGNNGLQFSLKGQGRNGGGSRGSTPRGRSLSVTAVASTAPSQAASSSAYSVSASGVDIRV